jgi:hypothetical protein
VLAEMWHSPGKTQKRPVKKMVPRRPMRWLTGSHKIAEMVPTTKLGLGGVSATVTSHRKVALTQR